jgi:Rrf2 family protein
MKLSRTVAYALQAALKLAEAGVDAPVPCSRLATEGQMPERFLLQVLRNLVTHGILRSTRGVDGGYMLGRPPEDISLLDLIEAVDGPLVAGAPGTEGLSQECQSRLSGALEEVAVSTRRQLADVKLSSLMCCCQGAKDPNGPGRISPGEIGTSQN